MPVSVYIATSLDGFIAGPQGDLSWLFSESEQDYGYDAFYATVDVLIMGRKTYQDCLSFGPYPYAGKRAIVLTNRPLPDAPPMVEAYAGSVPELLARPDLANQRVWIVGGGGPIAGAAACGQVDEWTIALHPVLLGSGTPLCPGLPQALRLAFREARAYPDGLVMLRYAKSSN